MPLLQSFTPEVNNPPIQKEGYLLFLDQNFGGFFEHKDKIPKEYLSYLVPKSDSPLMTDELKVYIPFYRQMGHFMLETLSEVTKQIEIRSGWVGLNLVVQPKSKLDSTGDQSLMGTGATVIDYFLDALESTGQVNLIKLKYQKTLGPLEILLIPAKNIQIFDSIFFNVSDIKRVRKFCRSLPDIKPSTNKKIYLSRRSTQDRQIISIEDYLGVKDNPHIDFPGPAARIFFEDKVENFLRDTADFEIICPEKEFTNFKQQIETISQATVLASSTSSGLLNMFFMPEESSVVELVTPLITNLGEDEVQTQTYHSQYSIVSHALGFEYVGIPHNRYAPDLIDRIRNSMWYSFRGNV